MKLMHDSLWNLARIAKHTLEFQHLVIIMHILTLKEISKIKNIRWYEYKKQPKDPYYLMFFTSNPKDFFISINVRPISYLV